jgi:hypothetical protein
MELCKYCQYIDAIRGQYTRVHMIVHDSQITSAYDQLVCSHGHP